MGCTGEWAGLERWAEICLWAVDDVGSPSSPPKQERFPSGKNKNKREV
jgi:hypothetical protein